MDSSLFPEYSELELSQHDAEKEWIEKIRFRVEQLLAEDPGLLFSYLYRLDVEEDKLQQVLKNTLPPAYSEAIAKEIWLRQKQRFESKRNNPQQAIPEGWEW
jgi:hypothetical protein